MKSGPQVREAASNCPSSVWRQFGSDTAEAIRLSHAVLAGEAPDTADGGEAIGRGAVARGAA